MAASDIAITLAAFVKFDAPDGTVRLSDGGVLKFAGETYEAAHPTFGSVKTIERIRAAKGDQAERGKILLIPNPAAPVSSWWRADLKYCRMRIWLAEIEADGVTASAEELLADWLVDQVTRIQSASGDVLQLDMMSRTERIFLQDEGNVCSDTFHQGIWPGESGFVNCTDIQGYFAWGTLGSAREEPVKGARDKKKGKG